MYKFGVVVFFCVLSLVSCEPDERDWISDASLVDPTGYFNRLMQETVHVVEQLHWCNLKLLDLTDTFNVTIYNWVVEGTVTYTNGFVVSIQKIDVSTITSSVSNRVIENVTTPFARIAGHLNLRDLKIGYDVVANLTNGGIQHYTGTFLHTLVALEFTLDKDLRLNTTASFSGVNSLSGGTSRMIYMPSNNITEVLQRRYFGGDIWNGVGQWGRDIAAIMLNIVNTRMEYPEVCFNNCSS